MTYRYHVSFERQLGDCTPHCSQATIRTQCKVSSQQDVQAIADLIHKNLSTELAAVMRGHGERLESGSIMVTAEHRKSPGFNATVEPNHDLVVTILELKLLQ
jgi:hypothetical protein